MFKELLFSIFFISYIFYVRIFRVRLPKELPENLYNNQHYIPIAFHLFFVLFFSLLIFIYIFKLFNLKSKYEFQLLIKFNVFFSKSLKTLDTKIKDFIKVDFVTKVTENLGLFLWKNIRKHLHLVFFSFFVLPRFFVFLTFAFDILFFHRFCYVYKISFLLILPLLCSYLVYNLRVFWEKQTLFYADLLCIYDIKTKQEILMRDFLIFHLNYYPPYFKNIRFTLSKKCFEELDISSPNDFLILEKKYIKSFLNIILPIHLLESEFSLRIYDRFLSYYNLLLFTGYLLIWVYILIITF